jgi:hypothetical protein
VALQKCLKTLTKSVYARRLRKALDHYLDVMERTWGFRPDIQPVVELCLIVKADFNIVGFAHKGSRSYVHAGNLGRLTPEKVAQRIMGEIVFHRNTCGECGTGTVPLYERAQTEECIERRLQWHSKIDECRADYDVPPDAVEEAVFPRMSARLRKRLRAQQNHEEAERLKESKLNRGSYI